ncbi:MAG: GNAT family N-acetyltransferase [bacterium]|nr:GNAT family N-acetyltransferase [bacterium]
MTLQIHRHGQSREADFEKLNCGPGCHCVAWWVPTWDGWGARTEEQNSALRQKLYDRGEYDGYLAYDGDEPVGWCQVGARDRLEKLREQFELAPDPHTWAITCFYVRESSRRSGVARTLLWRILDDLPEQGARRVEAFPKRGHSVGEMWNGPEALFIEHGFQVVREDALRPVLALEL